MDIILRVSYPLWALFVYEHFWMPFNSRFALLAVSTACGRASLPLRWHGFTTFPFFISTIKLAVRGETMASCRAWAFLRGEKKRIDYRPTERGLAVVFALSFAFLGRETREREGEGRKKRARNGERFTWLSRITASANRLCWLRIRNCFLLGGGGQVEWLTTNFLRQASHSPVWSIRLSLGVLVLAISSRVHHGSLFRLGKSLVAARRWIPREF